MKLGASILTNTWAALLRDIGHLVPSLMSDRMDDNKRAEEGCNARRGPPPPMLPEHVSKHTLADWKDSAASYVRQQLFDKKQFVTDKELMFGGTIQELVCSDINISDGKRAQIFWDEKGGKETVRNTFRRKRQAAQNAMKIAFRGK